MGSWIVNRSIGAALAAATLAVVAVASIVSDPLASAAASTSTTGHTIRVPGDAATLEEGIESSATGDDSPHRPQDLSGRRCRSGGPARHHAARIDGEDQREGIERLIRGCEPASDQIRFTSGAFVATTSGDRSRIGHLGQSARFAAIERWLSTLRTRPKLQCSQHQIEQTC